MFRFNPILFESSFHILSMGLFGIFSKKEKKYSIDEAASEIQKELESIQSKNKNQMENVARRIRLELNQLHQMVKEFAAKETPEFAKRSENVKERFCEIAAKQLVSVPEEPGELLRSTSNLLNNIGGLTQRQILHINIFFKEDFLPIGRKIREIGHLLRLDNMGGDYAKAMEIYQKIKLAETKVNDLSDPPGPLEETIKELKQRHDEEEKVKITEPDNLHLIRIRKSLEEIRQEIDSFLPVQKLLKKYAYAMHLKDAMIDEYINSPSAALLLDEDLKIIEYVAEASGMFSELNEGKREAILRGRLLLGEKRKELEKIMKKELEESAGYEEEKSKYNRAMAEKRNTISRIEQEMREAQKELDDMAAEKKEAEEEIAKNRVEFCMLAGKLLGANVG